MSALRDSRALRAAIAAAASVLSLCATAFVYATGRIAIEGDAPSHLLSARWIVDSLTPGVGEIGQYWLPLYHALELPFAAIWPLYTTGLAGSLPAMIAFVVGVLGAYSLGVNLTRSPATGLIAAAAYALNPTLLYLQAMPMMESTILCTLVWSAASMAKFAQTLRLRDCVQAGIWIAAAAWSDYGAWLLPVYAALVIFVVAHRRGLGRHQAEFYALVAGSLGAFAIVLWLAWGFYIQKDPLFFVHQGLGTGSTRSLAGAGLGPGGAAFFAGRKRDLAFAVFDYGAAAWSVLGPVAAVCTLLAVAWAAARGRLAHPVWMAGAAAALAVGLLFMFGGAIGSPAFAATSGDAERTAATENVRYAVYLLPAWAGVTAVLAGAVRWRQAVVAVAATSQLAWVLIAGVPGDITPDKHFEYQAQAEIASALRAQYDGGLILTSSALNGPRTIWLSGLDPADFLTEANGAAYTSPAYLSRVRWVLLVHDTPLATHLGSGTLRSHGYRLVRLVLVNGNPSTQYSLWRRG